jgi:hypothetical protein
MAHVTYERGDYEETRNLLTHLICNINVDETVKSFFDEKEFQGFILNSMLMNPPMAAKAA